MSPLVVTTHVLGIFSELDMESGKSYIQRSIELVGPSTYSLKHRSVSA